MYQDSLNKIVLEYLQKKGYGRMAEVLKAESKGLPLHSGPSPPQSRPLLDSFGPQEAIPLFVYERQFDLPRDISAQIFRLSELGCHKDEADKVAFKVHYKPAYL